MSLTNLCLARRLRNRILFAWQPALDGLTPYRGEGPGTFARNSIATYVSDAGVVTYVAANAHRIQSGGIFLEPQRTNLITHQTRTSLVAGDTLSSTEVAPDGTSSAYKVTGDGSSGTHGLQINPASTTIAGAGESYAITQYVKYVDNQYIAVRSKGNSFAEVGFQADLVNGTVAAHGSYTAPSSYGISRIGTTNWFRIRWVHTGTVPATNSFASQTYLIASLGGNIVSTSTGSVVVWGSQLEAGSCPTSHIPTAGAAVTRVVDSLSLPFTAGLPAEGMTVLGKHKIYADSPNGYIGPLLGNQASAATGASEFSVIPYNYGSVGIYGQNAAAAASASIPNFATDVEDDWILQVSPNSAAAFNSSDVLNSPVVIDVPVGSTLNDSVIKSSAGLPSVTTALIIVRGILTPAQMRALLRS